MRKDRLARRNGKTTGSNMTSLLDGFWYGDNPFAHFDPFGWTSVKINTNGQQAGYTSRVSDDGTCTISVPLAGWSREEIGIALDGGTLTVTCDPADDAHERNPHTFTQSWSVKDYDADNIEAEMKNGMLTITLPKLAAAARTGRQIEVK